MNGCFQKFIKKNFKNIFNNKIRTYEKFNAFPHKFYLKTLPFLYNIYIYFEFIVCITLRIILIFKINIKKFI